MQATSTCPGFPGCGESGGAESTRRFHVEGRVRISPFGFLFLLAAGCATRPEARLPEAPVEGCSARHAARVRLVFGPSHALVRCDALDREELPIVDRARSSARSALVVRDGRGRVKSRHPSPATLHCPAIVSSPFVQSPPEPLNMAFTKELAFELPTPAPGDTVELWDPPNCAASARPVARWIWPSIAQF